MKEFFGILFCLLSPLFALIGLFVSKKYKKNNKITIALSAGVSSLLLLNILHIAPKTLELIDARYNDAQSYAYLFLMTILGYYLLQLIDKIVPGYKNKNEHILLQHNAIITTIALTIYSFVNGINLYYSTIKNMNTGILLLIENAIIFLVIGIVLCFQFYKNKKDNYTTIQLLETIIITSLIGGLCAFIFDNITKSKLLLGSILGVSFGMIIYIVIFEYINKLKGNKNKRSIFLGIVLGSIPLLLTLIV